MSSLKDRLRRQLGDPARPAAEKEARQEPAEAAEEECVVAHVPPTVTPEPSVGARLRGMFSQSRSVRQSILRTGRVRAVEAAPDQGTQLGAQPRFTLPRLPRTDPARPPTHPPLLDRELRGDSNGAWFHCTSRLPAGHRHGRVALDRVLEVDGSGAVVLSGDTALSSFDPTKALFFDLETTGLMGGGGNLAFIVGVATVDDVGNVDIVQFLLREPGDEAALLEGVRACFGQAETLVSFNGKSFDRHVLADRFVMNRMDPEVVLGVPHLDLIHPARRIYRGTLQSCGLAYLEESCLSVFRQDDLPGSEAPAAWFSWLRTGDPSAIRRVQDHNALDLLSLVALTSHLDRCVRAPGASLPNQDALAQAGRLLLERGEPERGEEVLWLLARGDASDPTVYGVLHHLGEHLRRTERWSEAMTLWERMREAAGAEDLYPWKAAAIALEHRLGDPASALRLVEDVLERLGAGEGFATREELDSLLHRRERLGRRAPGAA